MIRPRRRFSPFSCLLFLALLLFGAIIVILLLRQPWNLPATSDNGAAASALAEDARQIAFMSNRDGDWDIYQMTLSTRETVNLTDSSADEAFPSYDFSGQAMTYVSNADRTAESDLTGYTMAADGSSPRRVQSDLPTILDILANGRLNWDLVQPFSGGPVFVSLRDLNLEVYRARTNADGTANDVNLSRNGAIDWFPSVDVTGGQVVFTSDRDGDQELYLAEADGTLRRLTNDPATDVHAVWLSDARQVLFYSERGPLLDGGQTVLYTLDTRDPAAQPASLTGGPVSLEGGTPLVADVQFAPGGGAQISLGHDGHDWEIYYTPAGGGEAVNLTDNDFDDLFPTWRPNS
ncbi:MAG: PD40 domain-containing protein [Anaerolineae bacterium]|nr:PD40 domain-containing protein [Anaerolineae bacterium]